LLQIKLYKMANPNQIANKGKGISKLS
jgi:hypothetical protein